MRRVTLLITITLLLSAVVYAQTTPPPQRTVETPAAPKTAAVPPSATATGGIAVIDFTRALTENAEGTRATNKLQTEGTRRQTTFQTKQKECQDAQAKLQASGALLSDVAKADLSKKIDECGVQLQRMQEDFQAEMGRLQQEYLGPVAEVVRNIYNAYAAEKGYAIVFDTSSDANNVIFAAPAADITAEVISRVDDETAKHPISKPTAPPPTGNPATRPPATNPPAPGATAPRPQTPPPAPATPPKPDPAKKP